MTNGIKSINPNIIITAAVLNDFAAAKTGFLQDAVKWLELGIIDEIEPMVYDDDYKYVTSYYDYYKDYQPACMGFHRFVNLKSALSVSCNCYFYEVGYRLGLNDKGKYSSTKGIEKIHIDDIIKYNVTISVCNLEYYNKLINLDLDSVIKFHLKLNNMQNISIHMTD